ncbi:hypothetical protein [Actinomadura rudentiformis]|uniref:Lipoprotein n=1 Tax=Actinomadura rudentiformis TaxID=359158 RepID=A0A6H9YX23_9ACTN|nr:hypothetical protein [Actinomadura rudentiformis]KAB2350765.1 hypothetical protein F8566_07220 [Actinomadura rudentiformis]
MRSDLTSGLRLASMSAAVLVLGLTAAGCSGGTDEPRAARPTFSPPTITTTPAPQSADGLSLPLEAYFLTPDQTRTVARAQNMLISDCMRRFGFSYPVNANGGSELSPVKEVLRPLFLTESKAARWGYHATTERRAQINQGQAGTAPKLSPAAQAVLTGTAKSHGGQDVPKGGCFAHGRDSIESGAAKVKLPPWMKGADDDKPPPGAAPAMRSARADPGYLPQSMLNGAFDLALSDPRTKQADAGWSACMKQSGYAYASVDAILRDGRWAASDVPSAPEIATAVTDARCRVKVKYGGLMYALQLGYQKAMIDMYADSLNQVKQANEAMVRNATKVLSGNAAD